MARRILNWRLVIVVVGDVRMEELPGPLASLQIYKLDEESEARVVFNEINGELDDPEGFCARVRELSAKMSSQPLGDWEGIRIGDRVFAWQGPDLSGLEDRVPEQAPPSLLERLREEGVTHRFGNPKRLGYHLGRGRLPVYETDGLKWRRSVVGSDGYMLLVTPPSA